MVKFLVVRFSSIGDIILTTPVVRHLKQQVDRAEIHYLCKSPYARLLEANPYVDRIHRFEGDMRSCIRSLKKEGFDYVIDLHHNFRSARIKNGLRRIDFSVHKLNLLKWLYVNFKIDRMPDRHMVDRNLDTIRTFIQETDDRGLDYFIPESAEVGLETLPAAYRKGYVALSIGAQHVTKKLPLDLLISLCQQLDFPIIVMGGPEDRTLGASLLTALPDKAMVNGCGAYSIHQSASLIRQSRLLITHDTGLMHIGAAFQKKIVSVWGNTVPRFGMFPYRADPSSVVFEVNNLSCRPCSKIGYQKCPRGHFKCMLDQDIDGIAQAARDLWNAS